MSKKYEMEGTIKLEHLEFTLDKETSPKVRDGLLTAKDGNVENTYHFEGRDAVMDDKGILTISHVYLILEKEAVGPFIVKMIPKEASP